MGKVIETIRIDAPAERVWGAIADFGNIHKFNPLVKEASVLGEQSCGPGAVRRCDFLDNTSVVETISRWEEGKEFTVELSEMQMPLKRAAATMGVRSAGPDESEAYMQLEYVVKGGPLGVLMDWMMMRRMMRKMFGKVLGGLKQYLATGAPGG